MFTRNGKGLTASGVKPICKFQQVLKSLYLFGEFSPITGDHFELEMPSCNTDTFQVYINEFSKYSENEFKIILLNNVAFHKAKRLLIPDNIALLFIPSYSPDLNPAEKIWWNMKRAFTRKLHKNIDDVSYFIKSQVKLLIRDKIISTCSYDYIFTYPFWTNTY